MADFKQHGTRFRVHPPIGDPVLCNFEQEQKEKVRDNLLHYVRVVGKPTKTSGGKVVCIAAHEVEPLDSGENENRGSLGGRDIQQDFWVPQTLDELAKAQNVGPLDAAAVLGTWPGEDDDGFEDAIDELRSAGLKKDAG